jgi:cytosine/adenosine deaminase-related metal-dependent hydrolase
MATINGAHVVGLEVKTGSLTPGKKADVVVIGGRDINTAPVIDPVAVVVLAADVSNVHTVIIDGEFHKRDGTLKANVPRAVDLVTESKDYLISQNENRKADWLPV